MFSPNDFVAAGSKASIESLVHKLDVRFKKLVDNNWFSTWYTDRIYVSVVRSEEPALYNDIIQNRESLINTYLGAGWAEVIILTSDQRGERAGVVSVELRTKLSSQQ